jgi:hypothetical protein
MGCRRTDPDNRAMKRLTTIVIALALSTGTALAQVLPQPKPGSPGGSCPFGYTSSGAFCIPKKRASDAIPKLPNGTCPWGWLASGGYCLRSGSRWHNNDTLPARRRLSATKDCALAALAVALHLVTACFDYERFREHGHIDFGG